jgi:hypothetical protein
LKPGMVSVVNDAVELVDAKSKLKYVLPVLLNA